MFNVKSVNFPSRHPMTEEQKNDSIYNSFNNTKKNEEKKLCQPFVANVSTDSNNTKNEHSSQ